MLSVFLVFALLSFSAPSDDYLGGPDLDLTGAAAAAHLQDGLLAPLPEGVEVVGVYEGGFQDRFVQIRLDVPFLDLEGTLIALGIEDADFTPNEDFSGNLGIGWPEWWLIYTVDVLFSAQVQYLHYPYGTATYGVDPDRTGILQFYLVANEI